MNITHSGRGKNRLHKVDENSRFIYFQDNFCNDQ